MNNIFVAEPMSRVRIRNITLSIRKKIGLSDKLFFPLIEFTEFVLPLIDKEFYLEILSKNEMPDCYAKAIPDDHRIILREDVYDDINCGKARHRFTLAHEIGHYIMHSKENILVLNRADESSPPVIIPKYKEPEWQANVFAAELLVPYGKISNLSIVEISNCCGVSMKVAEIQHKMK